MNRRLLILAGLTTLLAGCASAPAISTGEIHPELEALYSADARRDVLVIQVPSNGCTTKADFTFYVERRGGATTLSFARKRLDTCRSFVMARAQLSFTWAELGLDRNAQVMLLNPIVAWTGPAG